MPIFVFSYTVHWRHMGYILCVLKMEMKSRISAFTSWYLHLHALNNTEQDTFSLNPRIFNTVKSIGTGDCRLSHLSNPKVHQRLSLNWPIWVGLQFTCKEWKCREEKQLICRLGEIYAYQSFTFSEHYIEPCSDRVIVLLLWESTVWVSKASLLNTEYSHCSLYETLRQLLSLSLSIYSVLLDSYCSVSIQQ